MRMKLRIDNINPRHVHLSIFSDESFTNDGTFAHLGKLIMTIGEYQLLGVALSLGADRMKGRFVLMPEDPKFMQWAEKEAKKDEQRD